MLSSQIHWHQLCLHVLIEFSYFGIFSCRASCTDFWGRTSELMKSCRLRSAIIMHIHLAKSCNLTLYNEVSGTFSARHRNKLSCWMSVDACRNQRGLSLSKFVQMINHEALISIQTSGTCFMLSAKGREAGQWHSMMAVGCAVLALISNATHGFSSVLQNKLMDITFVVSTSVTLEKMRVLWDVAFETFHFRWEEKSSSMWLRGVKCWEPVRGGKYCSASLSLTTWTVNWKPASYIGLVKTTLWHHNGTDSPNRIKEERLISLTNRKGIAELHGEKTSKGNSSLKWSPWSCKFMLVAPLH